MSDAQDRIRPFVTRFIRHHALRDDDDIFALGLVDSMFALQLVLFVEREFGVTVDNEDLEMDNFRSVDALARFVARKGAVLA